MKYLWLVGYIACIWAANLALGKWGVVSIGFGLMAPAGVFFAGLTFTARDMVRETSGRKWMVAAIFLGGGLSYLIEDAQKFAIASGIAFLFSESLDAVVYEPLRRWWLPAVILSNFSGLVLDSVLFLWLAFGSLDYLDGQIVGKAYMTVAVLPLLWALKNDLPFRLNSRHAG